LASEASKLHKAALERKDSKARLKSQGEQERHQLQKQLDAERDERQQAALDSQAMLQEALCEAHAAGEAKQRHIAGAFKAARFVTAARESELRKAHDDLAQRFAARESRTEDLQCMSEQRACLKEQRLLLRDRAEQFEGLRRQLQNRDASDVIFGHGGELRKDERRSRSATPDPARVKGSRSSANIGKQPFHGAIPPLPGKKLNEHVQPFQERRRYVQGDCRALSADGRAPLPDLPILVR